MFSLKSILVFLTIVCFGMGIAFCPPIATAHEPEKNSKEPEKVPATVDAIWHEVQEHQQELETVIKNKQLSNVHEIAFHIRDLVNAMADKPGNLPAANLSKVKMNAKYLATLANRLDEAGDANDQARTEETYKKFSDLLKAIEAQYPPEMLKLKAKQ